MEDGKWKGEASLLKTCGSTIVKLSARYPIKGLSAYPKNGSNPKRYVLMV